MNGTFLLLSLAALYGIKKKAARENGTGESGKISVKGSKVVYDFGPYERGWVLRSVCQKILDEAGARNYWKIYDKYHTPPLYRWQWRFTPNKGHWYGMHYSYHRDVYINIEYPVKHDLKNILKIFKAIPELDGILDDAISEKIQHTSEKYLTTWKGG